MRILAIRGANLTSLAGEFAVDFERPPLDRAGIFAITGPTGSGKTTLLDAMCLALFDRTPRFRERGGVGIGRPDRPEAERLPRNDVRNLLRKGAAAGHAEVGFLGRDGRRWVARWEVRRARGRAEGRLQDQTLTLTDAATGSPVGRTKREVLQAIEDRLGLSFEQFCRSVLLAQGEFAAFLLAREYERAELLERMTGTEIYAEVSRRCHERASRERARLGELSERLDRVTVLLPPERAAAEQEAAWLAAAVAAGRARLNHADAAIAWHDDVAELTASLRGAGAELDRAEAAQAELLPLADEVAAVERAERVRDVLRRHDEVAATAGERDLRLAAAAQTARLAAQAREEARAALTTAAAALAAARAARSAAEPALQRARLLDAELARLEQEMAHAGAAAGEAAGAAGRERERRAKLDEAAGAARRERDELTRWLGEHQALLVLAEGWPRWAEALERARVALEEMASLEPELGKRDEERESVAAARAALEARLAALQAERETAEARQREAASLAGAAPPRAAHQVETAALARLTTLRSLAERAARIAEAQGRERAAKERETSARARALEAEEAEAAAAAQAGEIEARVAGVVERVEEARGFASLHEHRVKLRRGRPCPLCGSLEHPVKQGSLPYPSAIDDLERELEALRRVATEAATAGAEARERARASAREAEEAARERREAAVARRGDRARSQEERALLADDTLPTSAGLVGAAALEARCLAAAAEVAELQQATRRAEELEERAERWRARRESVQAEIESVRIAGEETAADLGRIDRTLVRLRTERAATHRRRDEALESLAGAFPADPDWRARLLRAPALFIARARDQCDTFLERQRRCEQVAESLAAIERETGAAADAERAAAEAAAHTARAARALGGRIEALGAERAALLGGEPADAAQSLRDGAVALGEERRQESEEALRREGAAAAEAESRRDDARAALEEAGAALQGSRQELYATLDRLGAAEDELRTWLERGAAWVEARRLELEAAARAVRDWRTRVDERSRALGLHESRHRPDLDREAALAVRAAAAAELEDGEARLAGGRGLLAVDDDRRRQSAELLAEVGQRRSGVELWDRLDELIGSADGRKLRVFAQSLTLESLLDLANLHLGELAPRYRLERVPAADLEVQVVDREMGDEARGANSLSGGETFLVSLALALGLSSLASRDTRIESLFIDEGFGSLDARALDQAISVLDSLQATGARVGLISHVSGLAERIGVQVRLSPCGGGRSRLEVLGAV